MAALAAFAASDGGKMYASISQYHGLDPAHGIEDDVVAYNLRAVLMLASLKERDSKDDPAAYRKWVEANS